MNFLQGVQEVVRLCDISKTTAPTSVLSQTGDLKKAVEYFQQAHEEIQNLWFDWDYLWGNDTITTTANIATYEGNSELGIWDASRVFYDNDQLDVYEWHDYTPDTSLSTGAPDFAVIRPDNTLLIVPTPDAAYTITYDFYKVPKLLVDNTDQPLIPDRFRRAIVGRAVMLYGIYESAPEAVMLGESIYNQYMAVLEKHQLSRQAQTRGRIAGGEITVMAE